MMRKCHIHSYGAHLIVVVFNMAVIQGHCMLILLEQNNCNMEMEDTLSFDVTGLLHNSSMLATD